MPRASQLTIIGGAVAAVPLGSPAGPLAALGLPPRPLAGDRGAPAVVRRDGLGRNAVADRGCPRKALRARQAGPSSRPKQRAQFARGTGVFSASPASHFRIGDGNPAHRAPSPQVWVVPVGQGLVPGDPRLAASTRLARVGGHPARRGLRLHALGARALPLRLRQRPGGRMSRAATGDTRGASSLDPPSRPALRPQAPRAVRAGRVQTVVRAGNETVVIGLAADSGCGKSTFMRRMTTVFGGDPKPPKGGNPDSNTLISEMATVICLDDYHCLDRNGRKKEKVTALDEKAQNFDLMYEQVKALKEGKTVMKPIYNHVTGLLDPAEEIKAPRVLVIEGLHPFYDERVRDLLDFKIYLDISDEIKFAWKIQRDMAERGHSLESIKASIEARKPDFDKFVDPQKQVADVVIQARGRSLGSRRAWGRSGRSSPRWPVAPAKPCVTRRARAGAADATHPRREGGQGAPGPHDPD